MKKENIAKTYIETYCLISTHCKFNLRDCHLPLSHLEKISGLPDISNFLELLKINNFLTTS